MLRRHRRSANAVAALLCFALLGYAYYLQHGQGLEPCPLCIFQRVAVAALGVAFVIAALLPARPVLFGYLASLLTTLAAASGAGVAARHLYIQSLPPGTVPACGASLDFMLEVFSFFDVLRRVLTGSGECGKVDWTFLGLAMPGWVLLWCVALGVAGVVVNWPRRKSGAWPA